MNLVVRDLPAACIVAPSGRIDHASADAFLEALFAVMAARRGDLTLILDFSAIEYISSAGLRTLMVAARHAKAAGGQIGMASLQPLVREVFAIARFELIVPAFDNVEAALKGLT